MRLTVKETAQARGFKNAKELADKMGMSYNSIYPLWKGTAKRVDLATLSKLCKVLNATSGLLMVYEPDPEDTQTSNSSRTIGLQSTKRGRPRTKNR